MQITWPIWTVPSLLFGIRALLVHPLFAREAIAIAVLAPLEVALRIGRSKFLWESASVSRWRSVLGEATVVLRFLRLAP